MQNDFVPVHLKEANANLDKHVLAAKKEKINDFNHKERSLWQKFLGIFTQ